MSGRASASFPILLSQGTGVIAQAPAVGHYGQVQGLFDHGRLLAAHTSVQRGVGIGGSAAARLSVEHRAAKRHIALLGERLAWHGGLTLDYLHEDGSPQYLECNPRTVEPANAMAGGLNIPDLQVRLTLGEQLGGPPRTGRSGVRTHGTIALLLGSADRGASRRMILAELGESLTGRGSYAHSAEQLTPIVRDPPSLAPLLVVGARLLRSPAGASEIASQAVAGYSIDPATLTEIRVR